MEWNNLHKKVEHTHTQLNINEYSMSFDELDDYVEIQHLRKSINMEKMVTIQFDSKPYF